MASDFGGSAGEAAAISIYEPPVTPTPTVAPSSPVSTNQSVTIAQDEAKYFTASSYVYGYDLTHVTSQQPLPVPTMTNSGVITVKAGSASYTTAAVRTSFSSGDLGAFTNTSTGKIYVEVSGERGGAVGVMGSYVYGSMSAANDGLIQVVSLDGPATGVLWTSSFNQSATGSLTVWAAYEAVGVRFENADRINPFNNAGEITVIGSATPRSESGIGATAVWAESGRYVNTGSITAQVRYSDEVSVGFSLGSNATIENSGFISADYAVYVDFDRLYKLSSFQVSPLSATIDNSGHIVGHIVLWNGNNNITNTGIIDGSIVLGDGNNTYNGATGQLYGAIFLGHGSNVITLGDDIGLVYGGGGSDTITGGSEADYFEIARGNNTINGGGGFNTLSLRSAAMGATVNLGAGTMSVGGSSTLQNIQRVVGSIYNDHMTAGSPSAQLFGEYGDDTLIGAAGADILVGGVDNDTLTGGGRSDSFLFSAGDGHDVITDFNSGGAHDTLIIYGTAASPTLTQVGADTLVSLVEGDTILLKGVQIGSLASDDILYTSSPLEGPLLPEPMPVFGTSYINFTYDFTVYAGETINITELYGDVFQDRFYAYFYGLIDQAVLFSNNGAINVADHRFGWVVGIAAIGNSTTNDLIRNEAGASLSVTNTRGRAVGIYSGSWSQDVFNAGLIEVNTYGDDALALALGIQTWDPNMRYTSTASGKLSVHSLNGNAAGLQFVNGGSVINEGVIEVSGGGTGLTAALYLERMEYKSVTNSGSVIASATAGGDAVGIAIAGLDHKATIDNSGLIMAPTAVRSFVPGGFTPTFVKLELTNTGRIFGDVDLGRGEGKFINSRFMAGDVLISGGNNIVDMRGGLFVGDIRVAPRFSEGLNLKQIIYTGANDQIIHVSAGDTNLVVEVHGEPLAYTTLSLDVAFSAATISQNANGSYTIASSLGTQTLWDVQAVRFTDQTVALAASGELSDGYARRLQGTAGADTLTGDDTAEQISGGDGSDVLNGAGGSDRLSGGADADTLNGGDGDDLLDGGAGGDSLRGGKGNDTYLVDSVGDTVTEAANEGFDTVKTSLSGYVLPNGVENLVLGGAAYSGFGNGLDNNLIGNDAANALSGLGGADTLIGGGGADRLDGGAGIDTLIGGAGDDIYVVDHLDDLVIEAPDEGNDTIETSFSYVLASNFENLTLIGSAAINGTGNAVANIIIGNSAANILDGGAGDDLLDGEQGADVLTGGLGDDVFVVGSGDVVVEFADEGTDRVKASVSFTLPDHVEHLTLIGAGAINGTGNALANTIVGNDAANVLTGGAGADNLSGAGGDDVLRGGLGDDHLDGGGGLDIADYSDKNAAVVVSLGGAETTVFVGGLAEDTLSGIEGVIGGSAGDTLLGDGLNNRLYGGGGNDLLRGGGGADVLDGGEGVDTASYADATTAVVANLGTGTATGGGGSDTLAGIENLIGGSAGDTLTGNDVANELRGDGGADWLIGGGGDDRLDGGAGDDRLNGGLGADLLDGGAGLDLADYSDRSVALVVSLAAGTASVGGEVEDTLSNIENVLGGSGGDTLISDGLANALSGGGGDDLLRGGSGADTLDGGAGSDTADYSDKTAPVVVTLNGATNATVLVGGAAEDIVRNVENVVGGWGNDRLTGDALANVLEGGAGNDQLNGMGGADILRSGAGADTLDGGAGKDTMYGGADGDTYYVDNVGDLVIEEPGEGADIVFSSVGFTLGANVENLVLTGSAAIDGTGNDLINRLYGNAASNMLFGGGGNDRLDGGGGGDSLRGGTGDDTYVVDHADDRVVEYENEGYDLVYSSGTFTLGANVEVLILTGDAPVTGAGNAQRNFIYGNSANNLLAGGDGNDVLDGGGGADTMLGGLGGDVYYFDDPGDKVIEYINEGIDTVISPWSYTVSGYVENVTLAGTADINATGDHSVNVLTGNAGANVLNGLRGADKLWGKGGADTFLYGELAHSLPGQEDHIYDFDPLVDLIDLRVIDANTLVGGDQAFTWAASFSGQVGQAVLGYNAFYNQTTLSLDANGDGVADFRLLIEGHVTGDSGFLL